MGRDGGLICCGSIGGKGIQNVKCKYQSAKCKWEMLNFEEVKDDTRVPTERNVIAQGLSCVKSVWGEQGLKARNVGMKKEFKM